MTIHEFLIHDNHPRGQWSVLFGECAATQQRDSGGTKEIAGYDIVAGSELLVGKHFRLALDAKSDGAGAGCWQVGGSGGGFHARKLRELQNKIADEKTLLTGVFVASIIEDNVGGKKMIRAEAEILVLNHEDSAEEQASSDQKKQSYRDLAGDHRGAEATVRVAGRGAAAFFFEIVVDVGSRSIQGRREAAEERAKCGGSEREEQNVRVQAQWHRAHGFVEIHICANESNSPIGEQQAEGAAEEGNQQIFREQLADDAQTAGAEREADGQFLAAPGGTRQKQPGYIGAGNQHNKTDGGHHDRQARANSEMIKKEIV